MTAFRVLSRGEIDESTAAKDLRGTDHMGRFNIPNSNMVLYMYEVCFCSFSSIFTRTFLFQTDCEGAAKLPRGLNIYPRYEQGVMRELPFFTPEINSLCYPFIHPYGETDFKNSSISLLITKSTLTKEELEVG